MEHLHVVFIKKLLNLFNTPSNLYKVSFGTDIYHLTLKLKTYNIYT